MPLRQWSESKQVLTVKDAGSTLGVVTDDRTPGEVSSMASAHCPVCDKGYNRELPAKCPRCRVDLKSGPPDDGPIN